MAVHTSGSPDSCVYSDTLLVSSSTIHRKDRTGEVLGTRSGGDSSPVNNVTEKEFLHTSGGKSKPMTSPIVPFATPRAIDMLSGIMTRIDT